MNARGLVVVVLATVAPCGVARGQANYNLTSTTFGSVGGVVSAAPFSLGMSAGLPVTGPSSGAQLAELAGFWRWGTLPVVDAGDRGADPVTVTQFFLAGNAPNPFRQGTALRFGVPPNGGAVPVSLRLYDLSGRLVRVLDPGLREPGIHAITWNGTNDAGHPVGAGIYFCRMEAGTFRASRRIALIR